MYTGVQLTAVGQLSPGRDFDSGHLAVICKSLEGPAGHFVAPLLSAEVSSAGTYIRDRVVILEAVGKGAIWVPQETTHFYSRCPISLSPVTAGTRSATVVTARVAIAPRFPRPSKLHRSLRAVGDRAVPTEGREVVDGLAAGATTEATS